MFVGGGLVLGLFVVVLEVVVFVVGVVLFVCVLC